jgi:HSP20 family protein
MDQLFERFFGRTWDVMESGFGAMTAWAPSLDVSETDTEITVRAEVPGIDPKDLEITVSGQMLTLAGEKKETAEHRGENVYRSERRFGSFRRSVQLPTPVDTEKVTAEHKNGVLLIRLQKDQKAVAKRIPVKSAKD